MFCSAWTLRALDSVLHGQDSRTPESAHGGMARIKKYKQTHHVGNINVLFQGIWIFFLVQPA